MNAPANTDRPGLLIVGTSASAQAALVARLGAQFEVWLAQAYADALPGLEQHAPAVAAVDLRSEPSAGIQALEALHRAAPELQLVALHDRKDPDLILQAMHAGAREFALTGEVAELERILSGLARSGGVRSAGTVITVFPAKGGVGATTIAANLAGALLEGSRRVVLVDLDFQLGDALLFLDLASRYGIRDVLTNQHRLDRELLASSLTRHASGLYVLAQPEQLGESDEPTPTEVTQLLGFLAQHFDYVICDGLRRFVERAVAALDASNRILLVLAQNVPAIRNAHRTLEVFRRLGYGATKVSLLLNRYLKTDAISAQDVTQSLGLGLAGMIANDYRTVMSAVNKGQLLQDAAPRAHVTDDLRRLALSLSGTSHPKPGTGFLKSLFGARSKEGARHGTDRSPAAH